VQQFRRREKCAVIDLRSVQALDWSGASLPIREAQFPAPFEQGVEYAAPARGPWNIVHVGMLVPESHQIFVCAQGCLRGVVLTAAEMGATDRFSTIAVRENNVMEGDMEELILKGVEDVLRKLPYKPRAVLLFTSCIHHFIGCDLAYVYKKLREKFPDVDFTDCYMNPIMRKSKTPPDTKMRQQLYSLLHPAEQRAKAVNFLGNTSLTDEESELVQMIRGAGYEIRDICSCHTYDEFQKMAESSLNITYLPSARLGGDTLEKRLGQKHLYLPLSYDAGEIRSSLTRLAEELKAPLPDFSKLEAKAEQALQETKEALGDMEISIDYTATPRPLGLARLLLSHGIRVSSVYADSFTPEEQEDFYWLKEHFGDLQLYATVHPKMPRFARDKARETREGLLAIGQKAAYFTGTRHFVNLLEGGGLYGFGGICRLMELMRESAREEKNTEAIIQVKGWGCCG
jgi:hypothetical protein